MNLYDFDGTIYAGDSGIDFLKYSFIHKPLIVTKAIIKTIFKIFKYKRGKIEFQEVKETAFSFVNKINNLDLFIGKFVKKHKKKIKKFYLNQRNKKDVIITASLDFYVKPLCHSVGIKRIIATKYDINKCKIVGNNCKGEIKEKIIMNKFSNTKFEKFYTDSNDDKPLFPFALNTYIVNKDKIFKYSETYKFPTKIFNLDFLIFIFCGGMGTISNFVFSSLISFKLNPVLSYVFGYAISLIVSYLLNILLVFKRKISLIDFIKFVISYIPNFLILFSFVYIFINILTFNKYFVYLMAAVVGLPITFVILKLLTFKKPNK